MLKTNRRHRVKGECGDPRTILHFIWQQSVDQILREALIVQILEEAIKYRWGALPEPQRQGIRNYISNLIIKISSNDASFRSEKVFLNKLNVILVQASTPPPSLYQPLNHLTLHTEMHDLKQYVLRFMYYAWLQASLRFYTKF